MTKMSSTMFSVGTLLRAAEDTGAEVKVLVQGEWLTGRVIGCDGLGAVLDGDEGGQFLVRLDSVVAVSFSRAEMEGDGLADARPRHHGRRHGPIEAGPSRCPPSRPASTTSSPQRRTDDLPRLGLHLGEVVGAPERLGVDLVDVLGAAGRAANHADSVVTLRPPIFAPLPGASVSLPVIGSPASVVAPTSSGESAPSLAFSSRVGRGVDAGVRRVAVLARPVRRSARSASCRSRRGSRWPAAPAAGRPCRWSTCAPSRRRNDAPADSSPPKPNDPSIRPGTNHLKPTGTSTSGLPIEAATRSIIEDDTSVLPIRAESGQPGPGPAEEVADRDREEVVGVHQPGVGGDDAVPVGVGVVAGGDVVVVLAPDQRRHRVGRGAVHPDLAVPVQRHEPPGRVDQRVDHRQVEAVPVGDLAPVVHARPAQRVGADAHPRLADPVEVEHVRQVVDVGPQEVVRRGGGPGPRERHPPHPAIPPRISSLARAAMTLVASESAGPPWGGCT